MQLNIRASGAGGMGIAQWALCSVLIKWWKMQSQCVGLLHLAEFKTPIDSVPICKNLFIVGFIKLDKFHK
jgi:hypothetical protein